MIYVWHAERMQAEDREKFDAELMEPLPHQRERESPDIARQEMEQLRGLVDLPE